VTVTDVTTTHPIDRLVQVADDAPQGWRVRQDERLDQLFEERCDWIRRYGRPEQLAVDSDALSLTFDELDARANQLARYLRLRGAGPGDRIALLFDQPAYSYIAMLAVLKISAAYVPLDVGFPADRMAYIVSDAGVRMVLSMSHLADRVEGIELLTAGGAELVWIDQAAPLIDEQDSRRLITAERGAMPAGQLAYIIYTSGSTGRPKGVAIDHPSICNFVKVAAEVYGIRPRDRVYQGLTIAFDFSIEEIWVPWMSGATLVPKPPGGSLLGADLHEFLTERRVTGLCCVPTLLATIEDDLPDLRFLLVSGEACPQDLIARWWRPNRRFLNVYGPTEATVTATWTEVRPDKPVTIGVPLPTYTTVILNAEDPYQALPHGETGEIGIAGIGLACGYLNRDDLTEKAFIPDFLGIPANPSRRIYRTGDLGRVNADGEIEYLGRIDLQVKIRGYRIELTEIESVLLRVPGIAQAVVDTYEPVPGSVELVGYYSLRTDSAPVDEERIYAELRERLPSYMVPAYLERLAAIPMTNSDKADRKNLPPPRRRTAPKAEYVAAASGLESRLADVLAATLGVERVSVDAHLFEELGASSLLMAQFSAAVRKSGLPAISIREIYQNPTIRQLAALRGDTAEVAEPAEPAPARPIARVGGVAHALCGLAQLLLLLVSTYLIALAFKVGFDWISGAGSLPAAYSRAAAFGAGGLAGLVLLPILAKWLLVGRWRPREIPLWGLGYLRFWVVKVLIRFNPMVLFAGTPLYLVYLRLLGAKIGRNVAIFSRTVPVATDLVTVGHGTVIHKDCSFTGYRAVAGALQLGRVTLGADVFVGEKTVLDIDTAMGDGAQLGHTSSLPEGHSVPAGQAWHGSPAEPTQVNYRTVDAAHPGRWRRVVFGAGQLLAVLASVVAGLTVVTTELAKVPALVALGRPEFYLGLAAITGLGLAGTLIGALIVMCTVPRLLNRFLSPGTVYPLYGMAYLAQGAITALTNSRFFMLLLGDSSFIVRYVRGLGYDLSTVRQTGSNFGTEMGHDSPFLTRVGTGSMVSDGLSIMNAQYSSTSFRLSQVRIGENNFIGNNIAFPAGAHTGDNVLLATKVMVPVDGPVRENTGLLGSPPFEIPRTVQRDAEIDYLSDPAEVARRLAAKNRHNARSIATVLFIRWVALFASALAGAVALSFYPRFGALAVGAGLVTIVLFNIAYSALIERAILGFRRLTPQFCSIYDRYFWGHERMWKVFTKPVLAGTPFQPVISRLAGVRIGRRVFDDGCVMPEKSLTSIGDNTVLNAGSVIQCHSLEDGYFKSGYSAIGAGCTLGVNAFVHYGTTMGDGSTLDADAFLIKGEEMGPREVWRGNPATKV
jgi:non-ribosomal peptide synthetase-like protein